MPWISNLLWIAVLLLNGAFLVDLIRVLIGDKSKRDSPRLWGALVWGNRSQKAFAAGSMFIVLLVLSNISWFFLFLAVNPEAGSLGRLDSDQSRHNVYRVMGNNPILGMMYLASIFLGLLSWITAPVAVPVLWSMALFWRHKDRRNPIALVTYELEKMESTYPALKIVQNDITRQARQNPKGVEKLLSQDKLTVQLVVLIIAKRAIYDLLGSGHFHIYRGVLSGQGEQLLHLWDIASDVLVSDGPLNPKVAIDDKKHIRTIIESVG